MTPCSPPLVSKMDEYTIADKRYIYIHDQKWPSQAIDIHHIIVRKNSSKNFIKVLSAVLFLLSNAFYIFLGKDKSIVLLPWIFPLSALCLKSFCSKTVRKESVVIIPAFGVQLETHYGSAFFFRGRITRHFVSIGKILKPVLNECVTPVTCYWSLSMIVQGEDELLVIFKELHPPVKMLVPIWKALRAATDRLDSAEKCS